MLIVCLGLGLTPANDWLRGENGDQQQPSATCMTIINLRPYMITGGSCHLFLSRWSSSNNLQWHPSTRSCCSWCCISRNKTILLHWQLCCTSEEEYADENAVPAEAIWITKKTLFGDYENLMAHNGWAGERFQWTVDGWRVVADRWPCVRWVVIADWRSSTSCWWLVGYKSLIGWRSGV